MCPKPQKNHDVRYTWDLEHSFSMMFKMLNMLFTKVSRSKHLKKYPGFFFLSKPSKHQKQDKTSKPIPPVYFSYIWCAQVFFLVSMKCKDDCYISFGRMDSFGIRDRGRNIFPGSVNGLLGDSHEYIFFRFHFSFSLDWVPITLRFVVSISNETWTVLMYGLVSFASSLNRA